MLGETVFSVLAQSYHRTGKGFNSVDAGVQNTSNDKYTFAQFAPWREEILSKPHRTGQMRQRRFNVLMTCSPRAAGLKGRRKISSSRPCVNRYRHCMSWRIRWMLSRWQLANYHKPLKRSRGSILKPAPNFPNVFQCDVSCISMAYIFEMPFAMKVAL